MSTELATPTAGRQPVAAAKPEEEAMEIEVRADGTILVDGKVMGRTNNPDEVRRRAHRRQNTPQSRAA